MAFVDISKAFDRLPRELLWIFLRRFRCHDRIVDLIQGFHDGMKVRVFASGALSDDFEETTGTKLDCVVAPVLFNLYMLCVTHIPHRGARREGIDVR